MAWRKIADSWVLPTSVTLMNIGERSTGEISGFWSDQILETRRGGGQHGQIPVLNGPPQSLLTIGALGETSTNVFSPAFSL